MTGTHALAYVPEFIGTDESDVLDLMGAAGTVDTAGGSDEVTVGTYVRSLETAKGNDTVTIGPNATARVVETGEGDDAFTTYGYVRHLTTGKGPDEVTFETGSGGGRVELGKGSNTLLAKEGVHIRSIVGGNGADNVVIETSANTIDLFDGNDSAVVLGFVNRLSGGRGDDVVAVNGANAIDLGPGADRVSATGWVTWLNGGRGDDVLEVLGGGRVFGGMGNDVIITGGRYVRAFGGEGDDRFVVSTGPGTTDERDAFDGGTGQDVLEIALSSASPVGVEIDALLVQLETVELNSPTYLRALNLRIEGVETVEVTRDGAVIFTTDDLAM